jgi:type I restriction enzyme, S subunit
MNYPLKKISELFTDIKIGGTPSRGNPAFFNGNNLWVSIRDMNGQSLITSTAEKLSDEGVAKSNCKLVVKGSLLFSFKLTVGKIAFAGDDLYTNEAIAAFDPVEAKENGIDLDYLSMVLPIAAKGDTTKNSMGASLLSKDRIYDLEIPVPNSIEEQKTIAKIYLEKFAEIEKAREATEIINQDIKRLKHLALHDFLSPFNEIEKFKLGAKAVTTSGRTPSRGQKDYWQPAEIPWIKTGEIAFAPITKSEEYVSAKALKECSLKLLPENTVLIAMYGQGKTRGQSAILKVPATINQACFAILPNETWNPEFLQLWLMYSYQDMRNMSENRGGNQANMNGDLLNSFEVPAPSIEIQQEVVKKINTALTELETMKASWANTAEEIKTLPNRLLAQAFNETEND